MKNKKKYYMRKKNHLIKFDKTKCSYASQLSSIKSKIILFSLAQSITYSIVGFESERKKHHLQPQTNFSDLIIVFFFLSKHMKLLILE